jgi:hypothetical protein
MSGHLPCKFVKDRAPAPQMVVAQFLGCEPDMRQHHFGSPRNRSEVNRDEGAGRRPGRFPGKDKPGMRGDLAVGAFVRELFVMPGPGIMNRDSIAGSSQASNTRCGGAFMVRRAVSVRSSIGILL